LKYQTTINVINNVIREIEKSMVKSYNKKLFYNVTKEDYLGLQIIELVNKYHKLMKYFIVEDNSQIITNIEYKTN